MPRDYAKPDSSVLAVLQHVLTNYRPDLVEYEVRFGFYMVTSSSGDSEDEPPPAIVVNRCPAKAKVRLTTQEERTYVPYDVMIYIDADEWEVMYDTQRIALIHHEVSHVQQVRDKDGFPKTTDDGRPKLKLRPDDWCLTGFFDTANAFGQDALEVVSIQEVNRMLMGISDPVVSAMTANDEKYD